MEQDEEELDLWDARSIDVHDSAHDVLLRAIGRVAVASAAAEDALRSAIYSTYSFGDDVFIFLDGEGARWLIDKVRMAGRTLYEQSAPSIEASCRELEKLFEHRNRIVHGRWAVTDQGQYVTFLSRRNKDVEPQACSLQEVEGLADRFQPVTGALFGVLRAARDERHRTRSLDN